MTISKVYESVQLMNRISGSNNYVLRLKDGKPVVEHNGNFINAEEFVSRVKDAVDTLNF